MTGEGIRGGTQISPDCRKPKKHMQAAAHSIEVSRKGRVEAQ